MSEVVSIAQRKMLVIHSRNSDRGSSHTLGPRPPLNTNRKSSSEVSKDMGTLKQTLRQQPCKGIQRSETQDTWVSVCSLDKGEI